MLVLLATPAMMLPTDSLKAGLAETDLRNAEAAADLLAIKTQEATGALVDKVKWRHWGPDIRDLRAGARLQPFSVAVRRMLAKRREWEKKAILVNSGRAEDLESQRRAARHPVTRRTHAFVTRENAKRLPRDASLREGHWASRKARAGKPNEYVPLPSKASGAWAVRAGQMRVGPTNTRTGLTPTIPALWKT